MSVNEKISIIVPVYNVGKYLERCLDSLVNQTFKDIEIICVNDGSKDNSLEILNEYEQKDDRILVIDKKNEGCSAARNSALEIAKGDYIMYVDGDDYVELTYCERMYNKMLETGAELVVCTMHKAFKTEGDFRLFRPDGLLASEEVFTFSENPKNFYYIYTCIWNKLFKKEDLKFYPQLRRSGDTVYFWEYCVKYNPRIAIVNEPLYYYYQNDVSIVHSVATLKKAQLFEAINCLVSHEIFKSAQKFVQIKILDRFAKSILSELALFRLERIPLKYHKQCKKFLKLFYPYGIELTSGCTYFQQLRKYIDNTPIEKFLAYGRMFFSIKNTRYQKVIKIFGIKITLRLLKEQGKKEQKFIDLYEKNKNLYPKDTYLLLDCTTDPSVESIDAYTLFRYMKNNGLKVKYITMRGSDIFNKLEAENNFEDIIVIENSTQIYQGDFLETIYETLLRTKAVLSSYAPFSRTTEKFFRNAKDIKYVLLQHGQIYIPERTLANKYLFANRFNNILVSSPNEANLLTQYGWNENSLIKAGLPRWDLLEQNPQNNGEKSILIMFTWRRLKPDEFEKSLYKRNILELINDDEFMDYLQCKNVKVYFAHHHSLLTLQGIDFPVNTKYIEIIDTQHISEYIKKCSCLLTDFTSVSFDFMFQNKPVIYYLVDAGDNILNEFERKAVDNFNKNKDLPNVFYDKISVVKQIKHYVETNFELEPQTKEMNDKFFYTKNDIRQKVTEQIEKICN